MLEVVWLQDNPVASLPDYRSTLIRNIPKLAKLDNEAISDAERLAVLRGMPFNYPEATLGHLASSVPATEHQPSARAAQAAAVGPGSSAPSDHLPGMIRSPMTTGQAPAGPAAPLERQLSPRPLATGPVASGSGADATPHRGGPPHAGRPPVPSPTGEEEDPRGVSGGLPQPAEFPSRTDLPAAGRRASGTPSPRGVEGRAQTNILYAVMALLRELDEEALLVVRAECEQRLTALSVNLAYNPTPQ